MTSSSTTTHGSCDPVSGWNGQGICVIMAGGRGTRFWPLSRTDSPKQLQALGSGQSLLRETFDRVAPLVGAQRVLVVTSGSLTVPTREALPELPAENVITEPVGRNTAPCAVLGAGVAGRIDPLAPVALLPADHFIPDDDRFRQQLQAAFEEAAARKTVVTIGIPATRPETGYGYLRVAASDADRKVRQGQAFVEKPDLATAESYVRDGNYFWNSGIFIWNPHWFAEMAGKFVPEVCRLLGPVVESFGTEGFATALDSAYRDCPADSIDFAVMEKLPGFSVLAADFRWSDLGSWDAWGELAPELPGSNRGKADLLAIDSSDNILRVSDRLVALVGVNNLIVVDTPDALLVCRKEDAQRIKDIITRLEDKGRQDLL
jgi:mannose-1-phosphate guanylyltransferase